MFWTLCEVLGYNGECILHAKHCTRKLRYMTVWRGILAWWMAMQCYIHRIRSKLALNLCSGTYWLCDLIHATHLTSLISSVIQGCDLLSYPHIWYFARATLLEGHDENKREPGWLLSTGPGAKPRLTNSRCTQGFLGVISHVCAMYMSVWDTQACICSMNASQNKCSDGRKYFTSWLHQGSPHREVTSD